MHMNMHRIISPLLRIGMWNFSVYPVCATILSSSKRPIVAPLWPVDLEPAGCDLKIKGACKHPSNYCILFRCWLIGLFQAKNLLVIGDDHPKFAWKSLECLWNHQAVEDSSIGPFESYLLHGQVKEMCSHIIIYCLTSQASHDGVSKQAASQIFFRSKPRSFAIGSLELCLQAWATQISDPTWQVTQKILQCGAPQL